MCTPLICIGISLTHVCMYVCMHVCTYVRMHVCISLSRSFSLYLSLSLPRAAVRRWLLQDAGLLMRMRFVNQSFRFLCLRAQKRLPEILPRSAEPAKPAACRRASDGSMD